MSLTRYLKLFSYGNHICNRFPSFYINYSTNRINTLTFTKLSFCSGVVESNKLQTSRKYYWNYMNSKSESYPTFYNVLQIKNEAENCTESLTELNNFLNNFKESFISDEQLNEIVSKLFTCDVNEICKKIILITNCLRNECKNINSNKLIDYVNKELLKKSLPTDDVLKILVAMHFTYNFKKYYFFSKVKRLLSKIKNLSPQQIVQLFYVIDRGDFSKLKDKYSVLSYINDNISLFNTNELGIIFSGMIKCNLTFSHFDIGDTILSKMVDNLENISVPVLQIMCQALFKLCRKISSDQLLALQEKAITLNFDLPVLLDISELGVKHGYMNSSFWEALIRKYRENINTLPPSFLLRVVNQMFLQNITHEQDLMLSVKEFEKYKDDPNNYSTLVFFLTTLSYYKLYPKNLIEVAFSEELVTKNILSKKKYYKLKFHWWILYCNLKIDKPECLTYELNDRHKVKLFHMSQGILKNLISKSPNKESKLIWYLKNTLTNFYGENAVAKAVCLPQLDCGLVLKFDKNLEAQEIPKNFWSLSEDIFKKPLDDNYWVFIRMPVLLKYQCLHDVATVSLKHQTECRQLKALGYIPILVPSQVYMDHRKKNTEIKFITDLIKKNLENNV